MQFEFIFYLLILISGDKSLNPGLCHRDRVQCLSKENVSKTGGVHFIYLNINSLLPKFV